MATISLQALAPVTEGSQLEVGVIIIPTAGGLECDVVVTLGTISETAGMKMYGLNTHIHTCTHTQHVIESYACSFV